MKILRLQASHATRTALAIGAAFLLWALPLQVFAASSPEELAQGLAQALRDKDLESFRSLVDLDALFVSENVLAFQEGGHLNLPFDANRRIPSLEDGVSNGELVYTCGRATASGCPWTPDGLDKARITQPVPGRTAIIAVDNEKDIRTWLVAAHRERGWQVTALASGLGRAEQFATAAYQDSLVSYLERIREKLAQIAEDNARREREWKEAAAKARAILDSLPVSDLEIMVDQAEPRGKLYLKAVVTNNSNRPAQPQNIRLEALDEDGNEAVAYLLRVKALSMEPGESAALHIETGISSQRDQQRSELLLRHLDRVRVRVTTARWDGLFLEESGSALRSQN